MPFCYNYFNNYKNYYNDALNSGNYDNVTVRMVVEPNYTINQHLGAGITGDVDMNISFKKWSENE